MAKRGFFAELQHQNQMAAKRQAQEQRAQAREYAAAVREAERAQRESDRAAAQLARATAAEQKAAEKEAKRLYEEMRLAEVESLNAELADSTDELDSILEATLDVDDFVDLEDLRATAEHPPFPRTDLEEPLPPPVPLEGRPKPELVEPEAPKGLGGVFGGKKKHAAAVEAARAAHEADVAAWQEEAAKLPGLQLQQMQSHDAREEQRLKELAAARGAYALECQARDAEVASTNERLDALISGVAAGEDQAIQEYVGIVLGNSVYPDVLEVEHEFAFDSSLNELELTVLVAAPEALPAEKLFKWVKAKDEITATALSRKDLKDRYASVIHQVALRSLHEIFEADRVGQIKTIALVVATEAKDPATGLSKRTAFVAVAAERDSFLAFDLSNVVPAATLQHLGAELSKNPFELAGIDESKGVRGR